VVVYFVLDVVCGRHDYSHICYFLKKLIVSTIALLSSSRLCAAYHSMCRRIVPNFTPRKLATYTAIQQRVILAHLRSLHGHGPMLKRV
jgi:hypothetical protein